nr:glycosyl hydrolase [Streptomyces sp. JJ38]
MSRVRRRRLTGVGAGAVASGLFLGALLLPWENGADNLADARNAAPEPTAAPASPSEPRPGPRPSTAPPGAPAIGAFLGSGPRGVHRIDGMERWLGGTELRAGHTYLPGDLWVNIEGRPEFLRPWARWRRAEPGRMLVLNVPMLERNEAGVSDREVRRLLRAGARGEFDGHFRTLAERLVGLGIEDTVVVLGWEMNGTTYTHRCAPDPRSWKAYWRRVVTTMRTVPGQEFRFEFTPSRGRDAVPWTRCYPGDDVVDVIGMDSYDQPPGETFDDYVEQPYGLRDHVEFAKAHGKPIAYPEWGLFRNGDNPEYVRRMLEWFERHEPLYQTLTDYCPHGVWQCRSHPMSAAVYREALGRVGVPPTDPPTPPLPPEPPFDPPFDPPTSEPLPPPVEPGEPCVVLEFGDWLARWLVGRDGCLDPDWPGMAAYREAGWR